MYRYPVEVISDVYLSRIGGFSYELEKNELGINAKAIEVNTSLIPNETYVTLKFFGETRPYFMRERFIVVGVEENMDCYEMTKNGEVVLPEELAERYADRMGEEVLINAVEFFRMDGDYSKPAKVLLWRLRSQEGRN